jgi:hypothetical protein
MICIFVKYVSLLIVFVHVGPIVFANHNNSDESKQNLTTLNYKGLSNQKLHISSHYIIYVVDHVL